MSTSSRYCLFAGIHATEALAHARATTRALLLSRESSAFHVTARQPQRSPGWFLGPAVRIDRHRSDGPHAAALVDKLDRGVVDGVGSAGLGVKLHGARRPDRGRLS